MRTLGINWSETSPWSQTSARWVILCLAILALLVSGSAVSGNSMTWTAGAVRLPDDYVPAPLETRPTPSVPADGSWHAVAIVGDVGASTAGYIAEMEDAAAALENAGVTVDKFYYGQSTFSWSDIVAAASGANLLLYMGHGVYGGSMPYPDWVGGFYLGPGAYVSSNQIRTDLAGVVAEESAVIFSHACFTAGFAGGDTTDLSQAEAERRVAMYADPFVDIGMKGYFANNYYFSATRTVERLLAEFSMGDAFKDGIGYISDRLRDLSYPEPNYDLWLNGTTGDWHLAFVGLPDHVLGEQPPPDPLLGGMPDQVIFLYSVPDSNLTPSMASITPLNLGSTDPLTWQLTISGTWFAASSQEGVIPGAIQITPTTFTTDTAAVYSGAVTVTVTQPEDVEGSPHRIDLSLHVFEAPMSTTYLPISLHQ